MPANTIGQGNLHTQNNPVPRTYDHAWRRNCGLHLPARLYTIHSVALQEYNFYGKWTSTKKKVHLTLGAHCLKREWATSHSREWNYKWSLQKKNSQMSSIVKLAFKNSQPELMTLYHYNFKQAGTFCPLFSPIPPCLPL